jgi:hypothetical protein
MAMKPHQEENDEMWVRERIVTRHSLKPLKISCGRCSMVKKKTMEDGVVF